MRGNNLDPSIDLEFTISFKHLYDSQPERLLKVGAIRHGICFPIGVSLNCPVDYHALKIMKDG